MKSEIIIRTKINITKKLLFQNVKGFYLQGGQSRRSNKKITQRKEKKLRRKFDLKKKGLVINESTKTVLTSMQ